MQVCWLSGRHGRGIHMVAGQPWQAVLPSLVPQELPGMPMVWSQATFPMKPASLLLAAKHSASGLAGALGCCVLGRCWDLEGRSSPA